MYIKIHITKENFIERKAHIDKDTFSIVVEPSREYTFFSKNLPMGILESNIYGRKIKEKSALVQELKDELVKDLKIRDKIMDIAKQK